MSRLHPLSAVILSGAAISFLTAASQLDEPPYDDNVFVSCEYRVAAIFPRQPMARDVNYSAGGKSAPARQFYVQDGTTLFSVTVANFSNGPAVDANLVEAAAVPLRRRGEIKF